MENVRKEVKAVLLIDDDPDDYDLLFEAIQEIDASIHIEFNRNDEEIDEVFLNRFDLILLDINMPGKDGFFWLNFLRQLSFCYLPIVMYTNSLSPHHIAKAYTEGANLYFPKPETFPSLKQGLDKLIHLDWSQPHHITQQYKRMGTFQLFSV